MAHMVKVAIAASIFTMSCKSRTNSSENKTISNVTGSGQELVSYWSVASYIPVEGKSDNYHCWYRIELVADEVRAVQTDDETLAIAKAIKGLKDSKEIEKATASVRQEKLPTVEQKVENLFRKSPNINKRAVTLSALGEAIQDKDRDTNAFWSAGDTLTTAAGIALWLPIRTLTPSDSDVGKATISAVKKDEKESSIVRSDQNFNPILMEDALASIGNSSPVNCPNAEYWMNTPKKATIDAQVRSFSAYIQTVKLN